MSRWLAIVFASLASPSAWAGACCVGSTATAPIRLGECEKTVVATSMTGEVNAGWWDRSGELHDSSVRERSATGTVLVARRLDPHWQVTAAVPFRVNHHASDSLSGWGGGLADVRLGALWDPLEERLRGAPVPVATVGLRVPTGRDWTASSATLHEDVTGLEQTAISAGFSLERTLDRWPWSVGSTAEIGVGQVGVQPQILSQGSLGRYLGSRWTLSATLDHRIGWASIGGHSHASAQTRVGGLVVHGAPGRWRGWMGARGGLPLRGAGVSATRTASVFTGVAIVL